MKKWYEESVFYHIYPLGLTKHSPTPFLDLNEWVLHIKELSCNAIYIGPLFQSHNHGYETIDYCQIDSRLGCNKDFETFVSLCHQLHIKVIVDGVFNHTGRGFFSFQDLQEKGENSSYKDWYQHVSFQPFSCEYWHGDSQLPCLNLSNPSVIDYLLEVVEFWIDTFDIDGIRLDCANLLDTKFLQKLRTFTEQKKSEFWLMGEVIHGDYSRYLTGDTLFSVTNYPLHKALYSGHNDHNYFEIAHTIRYLSSLSSSLYSFVDNHDEDRIASKLLHKAHLYPVYFLLFTLPGIPSLYYGSEWQLEGKRTQQDDSSLRPSLSLREQINTEFTLYLQQLISIRCHLKSLQTGDYKELYLTNRQFIFARFDDCSYIVCGVNNDDTPAQIFLPTTYHRGICALTGKTYEIDDKKLNLLIPANGSVLIKLFK